MEAEEHDTDWSPGHVINKKSDVFTRRSSYDILFKSIYRQMFHNKIYNMYLENI